jgi:hypothetical protein
MMTRERTSAGRIENPNRDFPFSPAETGALCVETSREKARFRVGRSKSDARDTEPPRVSSHAGRGAGDAGNRADVTDASVTRAGGQGEGKLQTRREPSAREAPSEVRRGDPEVN